MTRIRLRREEVKGLLDKDGRPVNVSIEYFGVVIPWQNDVVADDLYQAASRPLHPIFREMLDAIPPATRWQRMKWWMRDHLPHVHLGPCSHEECER